jgi:hypothetical protein
VPADAYEPIERFGGLVARFVGPQHGEREVGRIQPAVRLQRDAFEQERRRHAAVDAPSLAPVQLCRVLLDVGGDRRLEVVTVQSLEEVGLDPGA